MTAKAKKKAKGKKIQAKCKKHGSTTFVVYDKGADKPKFKRCLKCKHESAAIWRTNSLLKAQQVNAAKRAGKRVKTKTKTKLVAAR